MASKLKSEYVMKADVPLPRKSDIKASGADPKQAVKAIQQGTLAASSIVERELPTALTEAMESSVWGPFNRPKYPYFRRNGEGPMGGGPRDLIDMGGLHSTLRIQTKFMATKVQTQIKYTSPYALITHNGGYITPYGNPNAERVYIPARPWVSSVIKGDGPVKPYDWRNPYQTEIANRWNS